MAGNDSAFATATALHRSGRLREAEAAYTEILRASKDHFGAAHGLGLVHLQTGRPDLAAQSLGLAIRLNADNAAAHHDYALALQALALHAEALESFDRCISIAPEGAGAHFNRGCSLAALGRMEDAIGAFDRATALNPQDAQFQLVRANALLNQGRAGEAVAGYDAAIALRPDYFEAIHNRANALRELDRLEDALAGYDKAVALRPNLAIAVYNRAFALQDLGRFEDAMAGYKRAVALAPGFAEARKARGTLKLLQGRFEEGFADFEARLAESERSLDPALRSVRYWDGRDLGGKTIVVYGDGAFGDLIQFSRYLPLLAARGGSVRLLAPPQFHGVLSAEALKVQLISGAGEGSDADFRCEILSLPFLFRTTADTIPPVAGVVRRDRDRIGRWRAHIGGHGLKIGICWQGNPARNIDRGRSIPLAEFRALADVPGVRLISLQKRHGLDQLERLPAGMSVENLGTDFDEGPDAFVDAAAVMESLDLVVSSDTAIAHLSAALGRPTWIALRRVPEWRWLLDRNDSPWYPSVRLFRQSGEGRWSTVFDEMARALGSLAAH